VEETGIQVDDKLDYIRCIESSSQRTGIDITLFVVIR